MAYTLIKHGFFTDQSARRVLFYIINSDNMQVIFYKFDVPAMARQRMRETSLLFAKLTDLTLWCVLAYRPHYNDRKRWWKWKLSKNGCKSEVIWKRPVSSMPSKWKRMFLKKVTKKASNTIVSISVFECFNVE